MLFSVIIPTCNRNDLLSHCLDQLAPNVQTINPESYQVIITDDSKENVAKSLIKEKYTWATWVEGPKKGPAANRNNGVRFGSGEWLVFIDDDCVPSSDILNQYQKSISNTSNILAFEGRIFVKGPQTSLLHESPINDNGDKFWSCNICLNQKLFKILHGFDEKFPFPAMEDVDLFKRIKNLGFKHMFVYNAAVFHPWRTNKNLFIATLNRYQSHLYYISKHPEERERMGARYFFQAFVRFTMFTLKNAFRFRFSGFGKKISSDLLLFYFGLRAIFKLDKQYQPRNEGLRK